MKRHINTSNGKYTYTFVPVFLGYKQIDKAKAKENLILLKKILDEHHLRFMLAFGTVLGAMREHDFITHDEDIDLIMLMKDRDRIYDLLFVLRDNGFEVIRHENRGFLSIMRNGEYIDFYFFHDYPEHPGYMLCCQDLYYKDDLEHPELIDFLGTQFYVPRNPEKYLKFNYGENWRTPMQWNNYKMSPLKRKLNQLVQYFKVVIPSQLTALLQSARDKKNLAKLYAKAQRMANE